MDAAGVPSIPSPGLHDGPLGLNRLSGNFIVKPSGNFIKLPMEFLLGMRWRFSIGSRSHVAH
jgi:hypothetical protein